jgi:acetyl-CoA carboxylase carboxyltransferase component
MVSTDKEPSKFTSLAQPRPSGYSISFPKVVSFFLYSLKEAADKDLLKEQLVNEYNEKFSNPDIAAKLGLVDKIIKPSETRKVVTEAFKELVNKTNLGDKHGNIPL